MTTLHIQHQISDLTTWRAGFDRAAGLRRDGGVRGFEVRQPIGDPNYVVIDLLFDDAPAAEAFLIELQKIWQSAPALVGEPTTRVLESIAPHDA